MRITTYIAMIFIVLLGSASAQIDETFSFRGHRFGDSLSKHQGNYMGHQFSQPCNNDDAIPGLVTCYDRSLQSTGRIGGNMYKLEGITVEFLSYVYLDNQFVAFAMSVVVADYQALKSMLVTRYGPPTSQTVLPWQSRMGVMYQSEHCVWETAYGQMKLRQRSSTADFSYLEMTHPYASQEISRRKAEALSKSGRRAF